MINGHKMQQLFHYFDLCNIFRPAAGWRRGAAPKPAPGTPVTGLDTPDFGMRRITREIVNSVTERDKRHVGMGFVGRLFQRTYRTDRMNSYVKKQIDEFDDHR